jgi:hypothetical protein
VNTDTAQVDDLHLVAMPSAVSCAGLFARFTLGEWHLSPLRSEAEDAVSRLVRAVVDEADQNKPGFITVRLRLAGDCLLIEVQDDLPARPRGTSPALEGKRSGIVPLEGRGKIAWCELPLPTGMTASGVSLPRRDARRSIVEGQPEGERVEVDPQVVQRILSGLTRNSER